MGRDKELAICPYNSLHTVGRNRLQQHLIKCRIRHPNIVVQTCKFNITHVLKESDYQEHILNCPDRKVIAEYMSIGGVNPVETSTQLVFENDDEWDDCDYEEFNPITQLKYKPNMLIRPKGYTKSERKKYMEEEQKKRNIDKPPPPPILTNWNINSTFEYMLDHKKELEAANVKIESFESQSYSENRHI